MTRSAIEALRRGDCCIIATDTVYGLAAVPGTSGHDRIFALKGRDTAQVLPWLVSGADALEKFAHATPTALHLARMFWPGALTLVVEASDAARELGGVAADGTIALRCPDDARCLDLMAALQAPLACTSANLHGNDAPHEREEVAPEFRELAGYDELPESCPGQMASIIVDCTGDIPRILREGPIPASVIMDVAVFG